MYDIKHLFCSSNHLKMFVINVLFRNLSMMKWKDNEIIDIITFSCPIKEKQQYQNLVAPI